MIVYTCPKTGGEVPSGVLTDENSFAHLPHEKVTVQCLECGDLHEIWTSEVRLAEDAQTKNRAIRTQRVARLGCHSSSRQPSFDYSATGSEICWLSPPSHEAGDDACATIVQDLLVAVELFPQTLKRPWRIACASSVLFGIADRLRCKPQVLPSQA